MEITFRLAGGLNAIGWEHRHSPASATRDALLWSFFPGGVGIKDGEVAFETNFGWVPVLHFALSMIGIYERLLRADDATERYQFTESDDYLTFTRRGVAVAIEPSFCPVRVITQMTSMRAAVRSFTERVISDLGSAYPSLLENPLVGEIITGAENL